MQVWLPLLGLMALSSTGCFLVSAHMVQEEYPAVRQGNVSEHSVFTGLGFASPSIEIVVLSKAVKKKKPKKQIKQNQLSERKKPPPPPDCVPLWGSCKASRSTCCDACSFCKCRLFKTVCYCRMGNPRC
ncbi:hypothetical protein NHX12_030395 [Muraenolepis orangiensis]|uniref:Agouti-signaling protein n=1 Tax=Muraenolepis orangiensis TaxID=630683 RepID=A0A9Q0E9F1_9TELE|nr:hypothetical protein NHX12_030395 [Muraenolepis orangiensis]